MNHFLEAVAERWGALPVQARRPLQALLWALGVVVAVEVLFGRQRYAHPLGVPFPNGVSLGILVNGAIQGMLYAFLAFGLILVYRANRIINFAHAGLGLVPAVTALLLVSNRHWPYIPALLVMLIGSALVGAVVELAMRRFWNAPRLIATVVTIGFAQIFVYLEINLPDWVGGTTGLPTHFPTLPLNQISKPPSVSTGSTASPSLRFCSARPSCSNTASTMTGLDPPHALH